MRSSNTFITCLGLYNHVVLAKLLNIQRQAGKLQTNTIAAICNSWRCATPTSSAGVNISRTHWTIRQLPPATMFENLTFLLPAAQSHMMLQPWPKCVRLSRSSDTAAPQTLMEFRPSCWSAHWIQSARPFISFSSGCGHPARFLQTGSPVSS